MSPVLVTAICATSDSGVSAKCWRDSNGNGQSASPSWRSVSTASVGPCEATCHARIQPMPCSEWGLSSKFGRVV
jgi:hypothetical protein